MLILLIPTVVTAQVPCESPVDLNGFLLGVDAAEQALAADDPRRAEALATELDAQAECLVDQVHPRHLVRYGRARTVIAYLNGRDEDVSYWGQLALLDHDVAWPENIPEAAAVQEVLGLMAKRAPVVLSGRGLAVPTGGGLLIDGQAVTLPEASPEAPHLVQLTDADGRVLSTRWQDGTIWSESLLTYVPEPVPLPVRYAAPNPALDPYAVVTLPKDVVDRRRAAMTRAERARKVEESRLRRALEREDGLAERRERQARRRQRRVQPIVYQATATRGATGASDPVYLDDPLPRRDLLERGRGTEACADLPMIGASATAGELTEDQILCLRTRLATAGLQTERSQISRALMSDAWKKGDTHRWEGAMRLHLEEVDRSDADLCYILAAWLASGGPEQQEEAIRWARVALDNAQQWQGPRRIERVSALYRITAVAAMQLWLSAEQDLLTHEQPEDRERVAHWRNATKNLAREWLQFATDAATETATAHELCVSASGSVEYCDVG